MRSPFFFVFMVSATEAKLITVLPQRTTFGRPLAQLSGNFSQRVLIMDFENHTVPSPELLLG